MSSFGELLKRERELRQISLREVAEATKINHRYLEALERNDFRHLPGGVFNKGFVRAYAQYIGVDPEDMTNAYLLEERNQAGDAEARPQGDVLRGRRPVETPAVDAESISRGRQRVVVVGLGAIIVVAVVVLVVVWLVRGFGGQAVPVTEPPTLSSGSKAATADTAVAPAISLPDEPLDAPVEDGTPNVADSATQEPEAEPERRSEISTVTGEQSVPAAPSPTQPHDVLIVVLRPTSGRVVCDRRVEMLDGRASGKELRLSCSSVLVVDAADGGAVRIGIDGQPPVAVGPDRQAVHGRDLLAGSR